MIIHIDSDQKILNILDHKQTFVCSVNNRGYLSATVFIDGKIDAIYGREPGKHKDIIVAFQEFISGSEVSPVNSHSLSSVDQ